MPKKIAIVYSDDRDLIRLMLYRMALSSINDDSEFNKFISREQWKRKEKKKGN